MPKLDKEPKRIFIRPDYDDEWMSVCIHIDIEAHQITEKVASDAEYWEDLLIRCRKCGKEYQLTIAVN